MGLSMPSNNYLTEVYFIQITEFSRFVMLDGVDNVKQYFDRVDIVSDIVDSEERR